VLLPLSAGTCCWNAVPAAVDQYLLTDRRMLKRFIGPAGQCQKTKLTQSEIQTQKPTFKYCDTSNDSKQAVTSELIAGHLQTFTED